MPIYVDGDACPVKEEVYRVARRYATKVYDVPALPAGAYTFVCTVHPTMTGTATLE